MKLKNDELIESKGENKIEHYEPSFLSKLIYILFICFFVMSIRWGIKELLNSSNEIGQQTTSSIKQTDYQKPSKKYTSEDMKKLNDAGFVNGFRTTSTISMKEFCAETGYIPNDFILEFENQFTKTFSNADKILEDFFMTSGEDRKMISETFIKNGITSLENEYNSINVNYGMSKIEYCTFIDKEKDSIIKEKINQIKTFRPNMYLD